MLFFKIFLCYFVPCVLFQGRCFFAYFWMSWAIISVRFVLAFMSPHEMCRPFGSLPILYFLVRRAGFFVRVFTSFVLLVWVVVGVSGLVSPVTFSRLCD